MTAEARVTRNLSGASTPRPGLETAGWIVLAAAAGVVAAFAATAGARWEAGVLGLIVGAAATAMIVRRLEFGLLALLFLVPLDIYGRVLSEPVSLTAFQVVLLLCLVSWALHVIGDPRGWLRLSVMDVGMAALLLAGVWSLPTSLAPGATVGGIVRVAFLWAMALMVANGLRDRDSALRFVRVLVLTAVLIGLLALAQYFVPGFDFGSVSDVKKAGGGVALSRAGGFFEDPNYLGGFLSAGFVTALALLAHAKRRGEVLVWLPAVALIGLALLVTFSRTAWVGAAVGVVVVGFTAPRGRRALYLGAVVALAALVLVAKPDLVLERTASIADIEHDQSVATRYYMTFSAQDMIRDMPVFGTGLGAFDQAYPLYRRPGTLAKITRPHQLPLGLWAEMGLGGLLAEMALVGAVVLTFARRRPDGWTDLESLALAGVAALLTQTLFQYYLYFEYPWLYLALSVVAVRIARRAEGAGS